MPNRPEIITIFGATGFVGPYIVKEAARQGYRIRVVTRDPERALALKTQGDVGQIAILQGDLRHPESYQPALHGAMAVINLVGILFERGRENFATIHAQAPEKLAQHVHQAGVPRLLHMSALGLDRAKTSKYAKTKLMGERAVKAAFKDVTIFRPSVIFGQEDKFYNRFASLSRFAPALPLIGGGHTRFQPVYVGDVAEAFLTALSLQETAGRTYELGGPEVMSFRQILESILEITKRQTALVPVPYRLARFGATFAQWLPHPPLTPDQVELLKYDNVVDPCARGFDGLNIRPKHPDDIVPEYLAHYSSERRPA